MKNNRSSFFKPRNLEAASGLLESHGKTLPVNSELVLICLSTVGRYPLAEGYQYSGSRIF